MKVCNLCSEFIKIDGDADKGTFCPECEANYCFKCSVMVNDCKICGTETVPYDPEFDPVLKLRKTPYEKERKHSRKDYVSTFEYIAVSDSSAPDHIKRVKAVTRDISRGGMCIFTQEKHEKGQLLKIGECGICAEYAYAEVRWSLKVDKEVFRTGLKFVE